MQTQELNQEFTGLLLPFFLSVSKDLENPFKTLALTFAFQWAAWWRYCTKDPTQCIGVGVLEATGCTKLKYDVKKYDAG